MGQHSKTHYSARHARPHTRPQLGRPAAAAGTLIGVTAAVACMQAPAMAAGGGVAPAPGSHLAAVWHPYRAAAVAAQPARYTVRPGDTLSSIAERFMGSADEWPALWWDNHAEVANPDLIEVGQVLVLGSRSMTPAISTAAMDALPKPPPPTHVATTAATSNASGTSVGSSPAPADPPAPDPVSVSASGFEGCVISAESGGDPTAQNPVSTASGLFGFLDSTWLSVTGLPGPARDYSVATQTAAFWKLYDEAGVAPWAPYDGC